MWRRTPLAFTTAVTIGIAAGLVRSFAAEASDLPRFRLEEANVASKCGTDLPDEKIVIAAKYKENTSWLSLLLDVPFLVYQAERRGVPASTPHKHSNAAREASAYLMFIAEYYDCLPEVTAFVHGHRGSWHNPDVARDLQSIYWDRVDSYTPLSRKYFETFGPWFWSYPGDPERHLQNPIATGDAATNGTFPKNEIHNGSAYEHDSIFHWQQAKDVANAWGEFFEPAGLGPMPEEVRYFCCAQFAVPKKLIQLHPRRFYLQAIHWVENSPWRGSINPRYSRGLVFETLWHVIFGQQPQLKNPLQEECQVFACKSPESASQGSLIHARPVADAS